MNIIGSTPTIRVRIPLKSTVSICKLFEKNKNKRKRGRRWPVVVCAVQQTELANRIPQPLGRWLIRKWFKGKASTLFWRLKPSVRDVQGRQSLALYLEDNGRQADRWDWWREKNCISEWTLWVGLGLVLCMMKASPNKIIIVFIIYKLI